MSETDPDPYAAETESPGLLRQVIGQWKVWVVAAVSVALAVLMATRTEDTFFHEAWFAFMAIGAVAYALRSIEAVSTPG